jgi:hypothetical protein
VTLSTSTAPDGGISVRLGGLMGVETASLSTLSETRLRRLGSAYQGRSADDPRIMSEIRAGPFAPSARRIANGSA